MRLCAVVALTLVVAGCAPAAPAGGPLNQSPGSTAQPGGASPGAGIDQMALLYLGEVRDDLGNGFDRVAVHLAVQNASGVALALKFPTKDVILTITEEGRTYTGTTWPTYLDVTGDSPWRGLMVPPAFTVCHLAVDGLLGARVLDPLPQTVTFTFDQVPHAGHTASVSSPGYTTADAGANSGTCPSSNPVEQYSLPNDLQVPSTTTSLHIDKPGPWGDSVQNFVTNPKWTGVEFPFHIDNSSTLDKASVSLGVWGLTSDGVILSPISGWAFDSGYHGGSPVSCWPGHLDLFDTLTGYTDARGPLGPQQGIHGSFCFAMTVDAGGTTSSIASEVSAVMVVQFTAPTAGYGVPLQVWVFGV
jgi:hypothetical protein